MTKILHRAGKLTKNGKIAIGTMWRRDYSDKMITAQTGIPPELIAGYLDGKRDIPVNCR